MIKFFKGLILNSEFGKNVATLVTGTALAQAIGLLLAPLISRIYNPEDFGFYAVFMSVVSGVAVIACGRFELTILLPKDPEESNKNRAIALIFCAFSSVLTTIVILILFAAGKIESLLYLLAGPFIYALGLYQINSNSALRAKNFKLISKSRVLNSVINSTFSILLGVSGILKAGLIIAALLAQSVSNLIFRGGKSKLIISKSYLIGLIPNFKKNIDFLKFNSLQALSDMFMVNSMYYILPMYYNNTLIGQFALAIRILQAPMSLIGSSIAQVFYQQAAKNQHENINHSLLIKSTIKKSAILALPIPVVLLLWGPQLFAYVFGEPWLFAGSVARILSPWIYFDFIRASISQIPIILNKQKVMFWISFASNLSLVLILIYFGFNKLPINTTFIAVSLIMSIFSILIIFWIYKLGSKK